MKYHPERYATLNIGSIHFGGSYEDGIGVELFTMLSGRGGEVFHPFGKMGYSSYWLVHVLTDLPFFWVNLSLGSLFLFIYGLTRHISKMISIFLLSPYSTLYYHQFSGFNPHSHLPYGFVWTDCIENLWKSYIGLFLNLAVFFCVPRLKWQ